MDLSFGLVIKPGFIPSVSFNKNINLLSRGKKQPEESSNPLLNAANSSQRVPFIGIKATRIFHRIFFQ
jgi:hypothetical protein